MAFEYEDRDGTPNDCNSGGSDFFSLLDEFEPRLVHSKVPFSPWISEIAVFSKRYFGHLVLFGVVTAILATLASAFSPKIEQEAQFQSSQEISVKFRRPLDADLGNRSEAAEGEFAETETAVDIPTPEVTSEELESVDTEFFGDNRDEADEPKSVDVDYPKNGEFVRDVRDNLEAGGFSSRGKTALNIGNRHWFLGSLFTVLSQLAFFVMLCWTIKTLKTDNGTFRNLCFPSNWTIPKLIGSELIKSIIFILLILFICAGGCLLLLGCGLPLSNLNRAEMSNGADVCILFYACLALVLFIWVSLRLSLNSALIVDQNCGILESLKRSFFFMRKNVRTLLLGILLTAILFLGFVSCFSALSRLFCGHFASGADSWAETIVNFLICWIMLPYSAVFISVFYLMATGQCRPGAWARDKVSLNIEPEEKTE